MAGKGEIRLHVHSSGAVDLGARGLGDMPGQRGGLDAGAPYLAGRRDLARFAGLFRLDGDHVSVDVDHARLGQHLDAE